MSGEAPAGFTMLGDPDAVVCEGDACVLPAAPPVVEAQHLVARGLDDHTI